MGHGTLITLENDPNIELWEISITPPAVRLGDPVNANSHANDTYGQVAPRTLKKIDKVRAVVGYKTDSYSAIIAQLGVNQQITITFPDGKNFSFWGFLNDFEPEEFSSGEMPEATIVIYPSNRDDSDPTEEEGPVIATTP